MSKKDLAAENKRLTEENKMLKGVLQQFKEHALDVDEEDWVCAICGKRAPLETKAEDFVHETYCPFHPEQPCPSTNGS